MATNTASARLALVSFSWSSRCSPTFSIVALALFANLIGIGTAVGQAATSVRGTVTDPNGSVVVGANVALANSESKRERTVKTGAQGEYQFVLIPPGTYTLKVTAPGCS